MGKSLVMPRAASLSTIRPEIPSPAMSSMSSPTATLASAPAHGTGVSLNLRELGEAWNARLSGSGGAGARHGLGGLAGCECERSAARSSLRGVAGDEEEEEEAESARRSSEIMATVERELVVVEWSS